MPYDVPVHQSTKVEWIVDGQVPTLTPIRARLCDSPPFAVGLAYRRLHILLVREGLIMKRPVRSLPGRLYSLTRPLLLRAMMRKPSCLISCSHWLPESSLSVLVDAATWGTKYGWLTTIATFTGSKPAFCYPRLGHDALRLRRGKPRPAGKNKPSAGRGASATRALPELCLRDKVGASRKLDSSSVMDLNPGTPGAFFYSLCVGRHRTDDKPLCWSRALAQATYIQE